MGLKDIVIAGNGGFAKEVEWLIERLNRNKNEWNFLGFIDEKSNKEDKVIGNDLFVISAKKELYVTIAIGNGKIRNKIFEKYKKNENIKYPNLIDPSVLISPRMRMGKGNIICAGSIFTVDVEIGDFNIINLDCTIGHEVKISNYITVNPSVNISGNAVIGNMAEIGTGTQIIQGKRIGNQSIIGAGSVVTKDIPDRCTVVGVPGKIIKYHE